MNNIYNNFNIMSTYCLLTNKDQILYVEFKVKVWKKKKPTEWAVQVFVEIEHGRCEIQKQSLLLANRKVGGVDEYL